MLQGGTKKAATKYDVEESCNQNAGTQDSACSVEKSSGGVTQAVCRRAQGG